jgi:hypothetical protein
MKIGLMNDLSLGQTPNTAFANFVNLIDLFHQVNSWRLYRHFDAAIQPSSHHARRWLGHTVAPLAARDALGR